MSRHHMTDYECPIPKCTTRPPKYSAAMGLYLCQEHMLKAWALVQQDLDAGKTHPTPQRDLVPGTPKPQLPRHEGDVYYLRVGNYIKIGHSRNVERRLASYPPDSVLIALREGGPLLEREEHLRYAELIAHGREWFHYSAELAEDILTNGDTRPDWELPEHLDYYPEDGEQHRPNWQRRKATPGNPIKYSRKKTG